MQPKTAEHDLYHGLRQAEQTLPTSAYLDPGAYQRDLDAIWYRRWIMVCRAADIAEPLAYRVFTIGTQEVLVVRDETGALRAFHNTCRHRGSQLCQGTSGRLKARLLTCPYHAWSYSLRGDLVRVPSKSLPEGFLKSGLPALFGRADGMARFRLRQPRREPDGYGRGHVRRGFGEPRQLAA